MKLVSVLAERARHVVLRHSILRKLVLDNSLVRAGVAELRLAAIITLGVAKPKTALGRIPALVAERRGFTLRTVALVKPRCSLEIKLLAALVARGKDVLQRDVLLLHGIPATDGNRSVLVCLGYFGVTQVHSMVSQLKSSFQQSCEYRSSPFGISFGLNLWWHVAHVMVLENRSSFLLN